MRYLFLAASLLFTMWLVWSIIRRPDKQRLAGRLVAGALAVVGLLLTVFPPSIPQPVNPGEAILLTEGFEKDTLDALLKERKETPLIFSYRQLVGKAQTIQRLSLWRMNFPQTRKVHLLGNGLPSYELSALDSVQLVLRPGRLPHGIISLHWTNSIHLGEPLRVSGQYNRKAGNKTWLYLSLAGEPLDSVGLGGEGQQPFQLQQNPKEAGKFVYQLQIRQVGKVLAEEKVPLEVLQPEPLRILVLASFPTFENKFFKDYLAAHQHAVAVRTAISQGKFRTEWLNMPGRRSAGQYPAGPIRGTGHSAEINLSRLRPDVLRQFDLIVADTKALQMLTAPELQSLQQAVEADGLGLLALPDELPLNQKVNLLTRFSPKKISRKENRPVQLQWENASGLTIAATTTGPYALEVASDLKPLVTETGGQALVASHAQGWGTVAVSLLSDTYRWTLEGKERTYETYWSSLISRLAKKQFPTQQWQLSSALLPVINQPLALQLSDLAEKNGQSPPQAQIESDNQADKAIIHFQQDILLPQQFTATYWPASSGWHSARTPNGQPFHFYVFEPGDWQSFRQAQLADQTRKFVVRQKAFPYPSQTTRVMEAISPVWFFLLFLLSSGFLWLEEKL